ncbi:hypothetical protein CC85DRAFT_198713 [Cutaneotrichosporon oleaginosum]|uniref:Uncharacterized protein n=1 Tax=Cutaneotrichosporon oleaginosum TaxID=879819 RepID=A0A0J0XDY6_9TREE|nr:uncharacterized protein CC85DRAFT_198713 [Cutaneotrichosporon oleaginosum]KLT39306.1 hypothetical protein CC85DRAFT_198713 [Cutaneotrichosporon oleaginosum]TXT08563.1 hypothetical protein COLE_05487 [Cutaneotrichosporon oleaginosum]
MIVRRKEKVATKVAQPKVILASQDSRRPGVDLAQSTVDGGVIPCWHDCSGQSSRTSGHGDGRLDTQNQIARDIDCRVRRYTLASHLLACTRKLTPTPCGKRSLLRITPHPFWSSDVVERQAISDPWRCRRLKFIQISPYHPPLADSAER